MNPSHTSSPFSKLARPIVAAFLLSLSLQANGLDDALARMDKAAVGFRGLTASLSKTSYTALIKESTVESGTMTLFRPKPRDMRVLIEFDKPEAHAVGFQNKKAQIYMPKANVVQEYDLGKQSSLVDQFLLLGFGTPGSELKKSYAVKYLGTETVNGVKSDHLDLVPNSEEARKAFRHFEVWVSQTDGITVQMKAHQPSNDYVLFVYTDIKVNPPINESSVKLKLPKGVKKETPQK
ncbi:outer membrane lipoprotein carrier protein LolA [uncultured Paludibaculum sp.]|uniref:LolA family protein n=1 Tax=uncultured Paludibaculum sp. TaxID=1765020 RepID=UPI002AAC231F|nr:outer membrane lipoprotein carrier protein LolA [uncultured Paludibaculum sp.]